MWARTVIFVLQEAMEGNKYGWSLHCCAHTLAARLANEEVYSLYVMGAARDFVTNKNTELLQRALHSWTSMFAGCD